MPFTLERARALFPESLSSDSIEAALDELARITEGHGFITGNHPEPRLQGDIVERVPYLVRNSNGYEVVLARVMLLSNSCDMANASSRIVSPRVTVAPAMRISRWRAMLDSLGASTQAIDSMVREAARQATSAILYVRADGVLEEDLVVLLDQAQSLAVEDINTSSNTRLGVLTDRGHWAMLLKLSTHFCRLREGVDRIAV